MMCRIYPCYLANLEKKVDSPDFLQKICWVLLANQ